MARKRPTASDVSTIPAVRDLPPERGGPDPPDPLTHSQAHALRRCAPLNSADFKARGREVQQRRLSLRQILGRGVGDSATPVWRPRTADTGATAGSRPASARKRHD